LDIFGLAINKMANTSVSGGGAGTAANGNVAGGASSGGNGNFVKKPPIGSASWSFTDNEPDTKYDHAWSIANFARKVSENFDFSVSLFTDKRMQ
jgi:hypothetical protein